MKHAACALVALLLCGCADRPDAAPAPSAPSTDAAMNPIAEQYVKLVLAVGEQDPGYVDAYYGPAEWQTEVQADTVPLDTLAGRAAALIEQLRQLDTAQAEEIEQLRRTFLLAQLEAVLARVRQLQGTQYTFDEESDALYDVVAPTHDAQYFQVMLDSLELLLPGSGPIADRVAAFKQDFVIPPERVDTVFRTAIAEARRRTAANMQMPANERFTLEYVTDKSWSGYNWYQGNANSLIQINTDLPIYIDRAVDLGAHEGYPGHHIYNALLEDRLVRGRGWMEYTVYPLYSPQSLIAEGSANYGIQVAFPGAERLAFERDVLYPLAGLDPAGAERYSQVQALVDRLSYAGNEAARMYLNGAIDADSAAAWLRNYALMEPARAQQRVRFIDQYRSYVINYNYGKDLVRDYVETNGGTADNPARRWEIFTALLSSPRLPSGLQ